MFIYIYIHMYIHAMLDSALRHYLPVLRSANDEHSSEHEDEDLCLCSDPVALLLGQTQVRQSWHRCHYHVTQILL